MWVYQMSPGQIPLSLRAFQSELLEQEDHHDTEVAVVAQLTEQLVQVVVRVVPKSVQRP